MRRCKSAKGGDSLPNSSERKQIIAERKRLIERKERLWVRDDWREFDVFKVPVVGLVLNVDNRRFRAERLWAEEQLSRPLDPDNYPDDERSIESLLLDRSHRLQGDQIVGTPSDDYEALKNDWLRRRQVSPFWIRPDGDVRNGNRRLAMIKRLQRESGDTGLQWIEAVLLEPTDLDEPTLLEMEQREQLTENFKIRYNDIDYLLALREAAVNRDVDWFDRGSMDETAGELQTMVEKSWREVLRDLYAIKYMDQFLEDSGQPRQYHRLLGKLERFRALGETMLQIEDEYPLEAALVLQVLFAAVRSNKTHGDIRAIRRMFKRERQRFDQLADEIEAAEEPYQGSGEPTLVSSPVSDSTADEDEEDGEDSGPEVTNYPTAQVARAFEVAIDGLNAAGQSDVLRILREIRNRLNALGEGDRLRESLETNDENAQATRDEITAMVSWCDQNRHLVEPP
jgi:hypothetical protein